MYEHFFHFFGLRQNPFHASPDPRFYFSTPITHLVLSQITAAVETRQGLFVLTGEAGTGKTTLLRRFLDWMVAQRKSSCYIFHSQLKPLELFELILQDFEVPCHSHDKRDLQIALNHWLIERRRFGDSPVLIIDEAQTTSLRTLDRLNMFLNLELDGSKLLQIILAGQPELDDKLRRPELWKLQQRIISRSRLQPLSRDETSAYIRSRLEICRCKETIFSDESLETIHLCAHGIPRVINLLCEHALVMACSEKTQVIRPDLIWRVATDFDLKVFPELAKEQTVSSHRGQLVPACDTRDLGGALRNIAVVDQSAENIFTDEVLPTPPASKWPIEVSTVRAQKSPVQTNAVTEAQAKNPLPSVVPSSTAMAIPRKPDPLGRETSKQQQSVRLPANWRRRPSNFAERLSRYCREVEQSFVKDCRGFLQSRGQSRSSSRGLD